MTVERIVPADLSHEDQWRRNGEYVPADSYDEVVGLLREAERHLCFSILAASPNRMGGEAPFNAHCKHAEALLAKVRAVIN